MTAGKGVTGCVQESVCKLRARPLVDAFQRPVQDAAARLSGHPREGKHPLPAPNQRNTNHDDAKREYPAVAEEGDDDEHRLPSRAAFPAHGHRERGIEAHHHRARQDFLSEDEERRDCDHQHQPERQVQRHVRAWQQGSRAGKESANTLDATSLSNGQPEGTEQNRAVVNYQANEDDTQGQSQHKDGEAHTDQQQGVCRQE